jgi:DnaK suppressor protein
MNTNEISQLELVLRNRLGELAKSVENRDVIAIERNTELMDQLEQAGARDLALSTLSMRSAELHLVEAALERIAAGTHGVCLRCDAEIAKRRLVAVPHAEFCIACQELEDRERSNGDDQYIEMMPNPELPSEPVSRKWIVEGVSVSA